MTLQTYHCATPVKYSAIFWPTVVSDPVFVPPYFNIKNKTLPNTSHKDKMSQRYGNTDIKDKQNYTPAGT